MPYSLRVAGVSPLRVHQLGHRALHPVGGLVVADGGLDLGVSRGARQEFPVQFVDERDLAPLEGARFAGTDVAERILAFGKDERALVDGRQETVAEDADASEWDAAAAQHHESGQVPVLAAQPVADPGAHAGESGEGRPGVEVEIGLGVGHELGGHGTDHRQLVGHAADVGKEVADGDPAAPVAFELPGAGHDVAVHVEHGPFGLERHRLAGFPGPSGAWDRRSRRGRALPTGSRR